MRRLYGCELADILYIPPIRMGGGKIIFTFRVCMVCTKFGTKIQKSSHIRNTYTQKFTKCKVLGAEIYEVQSFCVNFSTSRQFFHIFHLGSLTANRV